MNHLHRRPARARAALRAAAFGLLASCGERDAAGPIAPVDQLRIVAQPTASDTIQARPTQALVVEVRDANGALRPRTIVRFSAVPPVDPKRRVEAAVTLAQIAGTTFSAFVADSTGADGRVSVLVALGTVAGPAQILINAPELGLADTLSLTVLPGGGAQLQIAVRDTLVVTGVKYSLGATVADRFKNPLSQEPLTFAVGSPVVSVDVSGLVAVGAPGRTFVAVRSKALVDTARVSVVPVGRLAVYRLGSIGTVNLDGSDFKSLTSSVETSTFPHAGPGGQLIAYYEGNPNQSSTLSVVSASGVVRQIATAGGPAWPRWSPDGQFIYFTTARGSLRGVSRIRSDGTQLQAIGPAFGGTELNGVGVSPDGRTVAVYDLGGLLLIDVTTGAIQRLAVSCFMPQFSPDGQRIACLTGTTIKLVNRDGTGERIVGARPWDAVGGIDWSPDGAWLIGTRAGAPPELINVADGNAISLSRIVGGYITQVSFITP